MGRGRPRSWALPGLPEVAMLPEDRLAALPEVVRAELLRALTSNSHIRADLIRQMHERKLDLAEVLMDLEQDDVLRSQVIDALRRLTRRGP